MTLRPSGAGRYASAAFLGVWLCGWAIGETFALWMLVRGAIALLTGAPPTRGADPLVLGPALAIGAFLLVWVFFWTIAGYAAGRHLLQLLWSSDRFVTDGASLHVMRRLGPFRWTEELPREMLRRIYVTEGDRALTAETDAGPVTLSSLGTNADREEAARLLRDVLGVPEDVDAGTAAPSLPEGWEEIVTPEGARALVSNLVTRRKQAKTAMVAAAVVGIIAILLVQRASVDPGAIVAASMTCAAAGGLGWIADRLFRGRVEWRLGGGSITRRWRHGARVRDRFEGVRLELTRHSDSDGDDWFTLAAVAEGAPDDIPSTAWRTGRKSIASALRDATVPRRLGHWLADRWRLPFVDRTTRAAMALDTARALEQLRSSGAFGRRVAGWIERMESRKKERERRS